MLGLYIYLRDGGEVRGGNRREAACANGLLAAVLNIHSVTIPSSAESRSLEKKGYKTHL